MRPLGRVRIKWSPEFAYAIGLITTDGNLSPDGRHMSFISRDRALVRTFARCLRLNNNKIGWNTSGAGLRHSRIQFGDINFYKFLLTIGLMPKKSKLLYQIAIPDDFFFDFLRGHFDGDGTFHSYWDKRWKHSFMFYTIFVSASREHIYWLQKKTSGFWESKGTLQKVTGTLFIS
jgi:hypothetical protein